MNFSMFFICIFVVFGTAKSMPGGWKQLTNLTSPSIQEHGKAATALLSKSMNSPFHLRLINITKGESQVVSGMNYKLEILVGPTECKKSQNYGSQEIENCPLQKCKEPYLCELKLWYQPWREEKYKLTSSNCTESKYLC